MRGFMRKDVLLMAALALVACAKAETANTDSSAAAAAPPPPAAVTAADLVGTFNGQVMAQDSDSVLFRFTCVQPPTGAESKCVSDAAPKDTTVYTYTLSGADSVMWTSAAYKPPTPPRSPQLIDHVVGRMSGGKWSGTTVTVLASKPDSVVMRTRWEATKTP
jgi:hypothetical protein